LTKSSLLSIRKRRSSWKWLSRTFLLSLLPFF
jgi:hypothetical protein